MSKQSTIQVAIYPTPAPQIGEVFQEVPLYDALEEACRYVYAAKGILSEQQQLLVREHFQQLFALMDSRYHLEVWLERELLTEDFWQGIRQFFPQFAWIRAELEEKSYGQRVYRFDFVPLVLREKEFPFAIHLEDSLAQQFGLSREEALKQAEGLIQELVTQYIVGSSSTATSTSEGLRKKNAKPQRSQVESTNTENTSYKPKTPSSQEATPSMESVQKASTTLENNKGPKEPVQTPSVDSTKTEETDKDLDKNPRESTIRSMTSSLMAFLDEKEEKRKTTETKETSERAPVKPSQPSENGTVAIPERKMTQHKGTKYLQNLNKRLEMTIENLEQAMLYGGIHYFSLDNELKEEEDWDKQLTISLREYTYLIQKGKFLEQVWQLNGDLVDKTEKMTVKVNAHGNKLIYERNQVKKIKENLTSQDIQFVLNECQLIESRVKVRTRPWFRKPYAKLMKMDYDNLLRKAAYFDLLQGENGILERTVKREREAAAVKDAEEVD